MCQVSQGMKAMAKHIESDKFLDDKQKKAALKNLQVQVEDAILDADEKTQIRKMQQLLSQFF
jgi:hypothetical protein